MDACFIQWTQLQGKGTLQLILVNTTARHQKKISILKKVLLASTFS